MRIKLKNGKNAVLYALLDRVCTFMVVLVERRQNFWQLFFSGFVLVFFFFLVLKEIILMDFVRGVGVIYIETVWTLQWISYILLFVKFFEF